MRYLWVLILSAMILSSVSGQSTSELGFESDKIESVEITGSQSNITNIRLLNESEYPDEDKLNVGVYFGIELNISEDQTAMVKVKENRQFGEEIISENPSYFDGPGHMYNPGLYGMIKKDNLEYKSLRYVNGSFTTELREPDTYYIVFEGTNSSRKAYRNDNGNCILAFEDPGQDYREAENCIEDTGIQTNYSLISLIALLSIIGVFIVYKSYFIAKRKILLIKINRKTEELENSEEVREDELENLYNAMDYALNGNYDKASEILDQID